MSEKTDIISIPQGGIIGVRESDVESFKGIPYAAPPVGPLRWKPPQPVQPQASVLRATTFGSPCIQIPSPDKTFEVPGRPSEDCLTLNVWRPRTFSEPLPVMVWIHGGAFVSGSSAVGVYDGANFARKGVILVSINYRLGRLGFFAHPALTKEASGGELANYGIMDQIAALKWVRAHISAFGGDPERVTLFGQSAGAISTNFLMGSPKAQGLFQRAISQSGFGPEQQETLRQAEVSGANEAKQWGIKDEDDASALRAVPVDRILASANQHGLDLYAFGQAPIIDGTVIPQHVMQGFAAGSEASVPYIVGTTDGEFPELAGTIGERTPRFSTLPINLRAAYGSELKYMDSFASDALLVAPAKQLADNHARLAPTYLYRFAIKSDAAARKHPRAAHGSELPYVFQNYQAPGLDMQARDIARGKELAQYWVNFAKSGNPNASGLPDWPQAAANEIMVFTNSGPRLMPDPLEARIKAIQNATPKKIKPLVRPSERSE